MNETQDVDGAVAGSGGDDDVHSLDPLEAAALLRATEPDGVAAGRHRTVHRRAWRRVHGGRHATAVRLLRPDDQMTR